MDRGMWWILVAFCALSGCKDNPLGAGGNEPDGDVTPPSVQILAVTPSATVLRGTLITIDVQVLDASGIATVDVGVAGAVTFAFPTTRPDDTEFAAQYPIPTEDALLGRATFTVTAVDEAGNAQTESVELTVQ